MKLVLCIILGFIVVSGLVASGWWYMADSDAQQAIVVVDSYAAYYELIQHERSLISAPGHGQTDSRQRLHELLTKILTADITPEERQEFARAALDASAELRANIDAATVVREEIELLIIVFDTERSKLRDEMLQTTAHELHERMRERQAIVNEITATLYAINAQTQELLETVVDDSGALTVEHTHELNTLTGMAEMRYDRLQKNYDAFDQNDQQLAALAKQFAAHAL